MFCGIAVVKSFAKFPTVESFVKEPDLFLNFEKLSEKFFQRTTSAYSTCEYYILSSTCEKAFYTKYDQKKLKYYNISNGNGGSLLYWLIDIGLIK